MKITRPLLLLLPLLLAWPGCSGGTGATAAGYPRKIVPLPEGGDSTLSLPNQNDTETESYLQTPKIELAYDEKLVQVLTTNLDADQANEQVIIAKGVGGEAAPLKLIIADYDDARGGYARSFETEIGALDERTIRIAVKDVIGNHTLQNHHKRDDEGEPSLLERLEVTSRQAAGSPTRQSSSSNPTCRSRSRNPTGASGTARDIRTARASRSSSSRATPGPPTCRRSFATPTSIPSPPKPSSSTATKRSRSNRRRRTNSPRSSRTALRDS